MHDAHRAVPPFGTLAIDLAWSAARAKRRNFLIPSRVLGFAVAGFLFAICATATAFTVTPSSDAGGSIAPNTPQSIASGTTTFTLTPGAGLIVVVGGTCGGTLTGATYTTNPITADCTVVATHYAIGTPTLAAGDTHTCAISATGGGVCWGSNQTGQLGDGTTIDRPKATNVLGLPFYSTALATGRAHSCAITAAGGAKCWGTNLEGELGDGTTTQRNSPIDVSGLTSGLTAITGGWKHTCALTTTGGVKCWGAKNSPDTNAGELGNGGTAGSLAAVDVAGFGSGAGVRQISAGLQHACAVTAGGGAKCWGSDEWDQLGDNDPVFLDKPSPVDVYQLASGVAAIAAGNIHTCALTAYGGVKCWGYGQDGALGDGTTPLTRNQPGDVTGLTSGAIAIASGGAHSCALLSTGGVKCWGNNAFGQLGDGTNTTRTTPVDAGVSGAIAITAGAFHTCARLSNNSIQCWGNNSGGRIGNGVSGGPVFVPTSTTTLATTTTALVSNLNPAVFGDTLTLTATVTGGIDGATVSFQDGGAGIVGCNAQPVASGTASCTTTLLGGGTHPVTATYSGDANTLASVSSTLSQVVNKADQTISFNALSDKMDNDPNFNVVASSSSGLTVSFSSLTATVCTVSGTTVDILNAGVCTIAASQAGNANYNVAPQINQSFTVLSSGPALALTALQSRKTHGAAGDFDIPIATGVPISGAVSVESRAIGAGHRIVFQFNIPITFAGTPSAVDSMSVPIGSVAAAISGNDVIVTLTGIPDNRRVTVSLINVNSLGGTFSASLGFLVGDGNSSRGVDALDIIAVRTRSGQSANATNFRNDFNASGGIDALDIIAARTRSGVVLP